MKGFAALLEHSLTAPGLLEQDSLDGAALALHLHRTPQRLHLQHATTHKTLNAALNHLDIFIQNGRMQKATPSPPFTPVLSSGANSRSSLS
jgi:hypothetical protein